MKKYKEIITVMLTAFMLTGTAFAETNSSTYKATAKDDTILLEKNSLTTEKDFSELDVDVIKYIGENKITIFSGKLKDYDNGEWVNIDFSQIQFMMILNWDTMENEAIYIVPSSSVFNSAEEKKSTEKLSSDKIEKSSNNLFGASSLTAFSSQIKINGVNVGENGMRIIDNANLSCTFTITNNSSDSQKISAILATYTENKTLYQVKKINTPLVAPGKTESIQVAYKFNAKKEYSGKLMFWNDKMMPFRATVDFTQNSGVNAYYYNADNRLLQVDKANNTSVYYTYDNMGNLLTKTVRGAE